MNRLRHFLHRPNGTLRAPLFGYRAVASLSRAMEWLISKDVTYMTTPLAMYACIFELSLNFHPSPHWNTDLCYVRSVAGGELSCESNPCVTFHRPDGTLCAPLLESGEVLRKGKQCRALASTVQPTVDYTGSLWTHRNRLAGGAVSRLLNVHGKSGRQFRPFLNVHGRNSASQVSEYWLRYGLRLLCSR